MPDWPAPMDLATNEEMRHAIVNEEKRRRDHGFKRAVLPPNGEQESNENEEGTDANNAEEEEEAETGQRNPKPRILYDPSL
jgi:hypothetical protein